MLHNHKTADIAQGMLGNCWYDHVNVWFSFSCFNAFLKTSVFENENATPIGIDIFLLVESRINNQNFVSVIQKKLHELFTPTGSETISLLVRADILTIAIVIQIYNYHKETTRVQSCFVSPLCCKVANPITGS